MKKVFIFLIMVMVSLAGCSDEAGIFADPTYANDGFKGITFTDVTGTPIGPVDESDWNLYVGTPSFAVSKESLESPPASASKVLPDQFYVSEAYPNPTKDVITFFFDTPIALEWSLYIIDDNYRVLKSFGSYSEAGRVEINWDMRDESGKKLADDIYRVIYEWEGLWGYGDIWVSDYQLPDAPD